MHHVLTFGAVVGLDDYIIQSVLIETVYFARSWYLLILALRGYLKIFVYHCVTMELRIKMFRYGSMAM